MDDCIFCRISNEEMPARIVFADDLLVVIEDIAPVAPLHLLLIPRKHVVNCLNLTSADNELMGHVFQTAARIAREKGVAEDGFRIVTNTNSAAGQSVRHIHFHLLAGRTLSWPPG